MTDTTVSSAATCDLPGMLPARTAIDRLTEYREGQGAIPFPNSALSVLSNFLNTISVLGEPASRAIAQQQQLRYSNHSLRRIALGLEPDAQKFSVIALKHVMGPAQAEAYMQDYKAPVPAPAKPAGLPEELTVDMENAFINAIPVLTRDEANHPNDTGKPNWTALQDPGVLARCFAAAVAAAKA